MVACCPRADRLSGVEGFHVLEVTAGEDGRLLVDVESDQTLTGCPDCGVVAVGQAGGVARRRAPQRAGRQGGVAEADLALPRAGLSGGFVQPGRRRPRPTAGAAERPRGVVGGPGSCVASTPP